MLSWLRGLLGSRARGGVAWPPGAPVIFLSLPPSLKNGIAPSASKEEIVALAREAARDLTESERFVPFVYLGAGGRRLPVFTSEERASEFAEAYVKEVGRIMPFQVLTVDTSMLDTLTKACDVMTVDDRTSGMREVVVNRLSIDHNF